MLDTALVLGARATTALLLDSVDRQVAALARLAQRHRGDLMAGRTLTQHAVPITFGLKAAQWLQGVLDARDDLRALRFPVQLGGAAGTLAAVTELAGDSDAALFLVAETARILRLDRVPSWHTSRAPLTRYADALVRATDAMGHIANDVLLLARPEIAELAEPAVAGRGGSSTMPQKANPVLSVLIRRAALAAPAQAAQLHLAAASTLDERPDGSWHTEWTALATPVAAHAHRRLADGRAPRRSARGHRPDGRRRQAAGLRPARRAPQHPRPDGVRGDRSRRPRTTSTRSTTWVRPRR